MSSLRASALARYLALAYLGLVVYASLHPFTGWRDSGVSPWAFLGGGWPRYWTVFDLAVNVGVYLPLGFLLGFVFGGGRRRWLATLAAVGIAAATSLGLETLQNWLPSRVPSSLDFACNAAGGLIGAVLAHLFGPPAAERLGEPRASHLAPVPQLEAGLTLLALWLLAQLSPETVLFGSGDLRRLFGELQPERFSAEFQFAIEATVVGCNMLTVGLLLRQLIAREVFALPPLLLFFVVALAIRAVATAVVVTPAEAFAWLTPGALRGLLAGAGVLAIAVFLPGWLRLSLASLTLLVGTVVVNLAPASPYHQAALAAWQQGHFLNFNGLTRVVSVLWPFLALPYLSLLARRGGR